MNNLIKKITLGLGLAAIFWLSATQNLNAQINPEPSEPLTAEGVVVSIKEAGRESFNDELVPFQQLEILLTSGIYKDQVFLVKNSAAGADVTASYQDYRPNDKVRLSLNPTLAPAAEPELVILGPIKRHGLMSLGLLFVLAVLTIGRVWGVMSLLGLGISFSVIFYLIIPLIIKGYDPVLATLLGAAIIIPATFYVSHGINKKTHVGVVATLISLAFTGFLALIFIKRTHLTGFASEEAGFLQIERSGSIDIKGLLLAGIIIGTLGILDDVTIGQASVVEQIKRTNPATGFVRLFQRGMKVGQDHISSMVNTLVLVYAGSSLPLLLLFFGSNKGFVEILEFELVAEEIVKMLVGSIGLIFAAPLATVLAAYVFSKTKLEDSSAKTNDAHQHGGHHH